MSDLRRKADALGRVAAQLRRDRSVVHLQAASPPAHPDITVCGERAVGAIADNLADVAR